MVLLVETATTCAGQLNSSGNSEGEMKHDETRGRQNCILHQLRAISTSSNLYENIFQFAKNYTSCISVMFGQDQHGHLAGGVQICRKRCSSS